MEDFFSFEILSLGSFNITIGSILFALFILLGTWIADYFFNRILLRKYLKKREVDTGRSYSISRIFRYLIFAVGIVSAIQVFTGSMSVLFLGSAGLLVGIGFGLQETFRDFLSGIILLVEGNISVGNVVALDGMIGIVRRIGLRTSEVLSRDKVTIIVPNSRLVSNEVTNWSHNETAARYYIDVGVAYGSDIDKVEKVIHYALGEIPDILFDPAPTIELIDFANSSLIFRAYFFSEQFFYIERVKSDLRKFIFKSFAKESINIPFPQMDVRIKNTDEKLK